MTYWIAYTASLLLGAAVGWAIVLVGHRLIFGRWLP